MNINNTLPFKTLLPTGATSNTNNRPQTGAAAPQRSGDSQAAFARTLGRARTDPVAPPSAGGVFGSGTGGAYAPMQGAAIKANSAAAAAALDRKRPAEAQKAQATAKADPAEATPQPPLETGGPDVPTDGGAGTDPAADSAIDKRAAADKHAAADRHAAASTRTRVIRPPAGPGPGAPGATDPHAVTAPGRPVPPFQPLQPMPAVLKPDDGDGDGTVTGGGDGDADGKELIAIKVPFSDEPGGALPLVECPVDGDPAMAAVAVPTRQIDDTTTRADTGNTSKTGNGTGSADSSKSVKAGAVAAETVDSKTGAGVRSGGLPNPPIKHYGTEPVHNVDGADPGAAGDAKGSAGQAFGAQLQAVLGAGADAAAASAPAINAAASTTPSAASAAPGATDGAALLQGQLSAKPGSPEFAPQLAAQISTFVRDGVQHARLELNPAEMGPLTVQIKLDGVLANVNMAAQHADTRHALEQAMPELASTLREAGLTLSGGGVSEQPQQPQPNQAGQTGDGPSAKAHPKAADRIDHGSDQSSRDSRRTAAAVPALRQRGMVDLIA